MKEYIKHENTLRLLISLFDSKKDHEKYYQGRIEETLTEMRGLHFDLDRIVRIMEGDDKQEIERLKVLRREEAKFV